MQFITLKSHMSVGMSTSLQQPVQLSEQSSEQLWEGGEDDVFTESVVQRSRWGGGGGAVLGQRPPALLDPKKPTLQAYSKDLLRTRWALSSSPC